MSCKDAMILVPFVQIRKLRVRMLNVTVTQLLSGTVGTLHDWSESLACYLNVGNFRGPFLTLPFSSVSLCLMPSVPMVSGMTSSW